MFLKYKTYIYLYISLRDFVFLFFLFIIISDFFPSPYAQENTLDINIPTASNFAYPQSVFVDSKDGHIWITDFDHNRVLRFNIKNISAIDEISETIAGLSLSQNYPNPFNSETVISFNTEHSGMVELIIYNILGQKVSTVYKGFVSAGKSYSIKYNAENLPGGIYLYSLITPFGIETKSMCYLK